MKKFTQCMVMAILIFIMSANANAWTVYIENEASAEVKVRVKGEHLFWQQVDCETTVQGYSKDTCAMPGGICPVAVNATYKWKNGTVKEVNCPAFYGVPLACMDIIVSLFEAGVGIGGCKYYPK